MVHSADLELTAEEQRVLGSLIEKERATPDQYPLTTNGLRTACNQKSNRDPVVDFGDGDVEAAMLSLRDKGYARTVTGSGRTVKHKQVLDEALGLSNGEVSLLGVLMLRGAQTPNELRTRTERLHGFEDNAAVERTLDVMAAGEPPLVRCVGRASGQREDRWVHLLGDGSGPSVAQAGGQVAVVSGAAAAAATATAAAPSRAGQTGRVDRADEPLPPPAQPLAPAGAPTATPTMAGSTAGDSDERIAELEAEVAELRSEVERLRYRFDDLAEQLGISPS